MGQEVVTFSQAESRDAEKIAEIHDAAWLATYRGIIPHLHLERMIARRGPRWWQRQLESGSCVTLLNFDGYPQGYASWGRARGAWPFPAGEIYELYINPSHQGVGLGSRLFRHVRKTLRDDGLHRLVIWALKDNEQACAFYGGLGGTIAAVAPERYGETTLTRIAFVWGVNVKSLET
jgi:ribosomal protein S18 acetylase RimI-like enzyme